MNIEQNKGHGHLIKRPDGVRARCGGPAFCKVCQAEKAQLERATAAPAESVDTPVFRTILPPASILGQTYENVVRHIDAWGAQRYEAGRQAAWSAECNADGLREENAELRARAEAAEAALGDANTKLVIACEKMLCEALGRSWAPAGMSFESLINDVKAALASRPAVDLSDVIRYTRHARVIQNPAGANPNGPWEDFYACDDVQALLAQGGQPTLKESLTVAAPAPGELPPFPPITGYIASLQDGALNSAVCQYAQIYARQARADALEEAAKLAIQWGDARHDDRGGYALRNFAQALRNGERPTTIRALNKKGGAA